MFRDTHSSEPPICIQFSSKTQSAVLIPAISAWRAEHDWSSFFLTVSVCQELASDELILLLVLWRLVPAFSQREAQELAAPPSSCQASSAAENSISLSLGRFLDGTNLINCYFSPLGTQMLFLLGFFLFFFFFKFVNLLWTHYFLRVSLSIYQLIPRPPKAKTVLSPIFFPKRWPISTWALTDLWASGGRTYEQLWCVVTGAL